MARVSKSWNKDDTPGLIARKKVDWTVFETGTHIPVEYHEYFREANGGILPDRGQSISVKLRLNEIDYDAVLTNVDRQGVAADTLQLRYQSNSVLRKQLLEVFYPSYDFIKEKRLRNENRGKKQDIIVPDNRAEYIEFYKTDTPLIYQLKLMKWRKAGSVQEESPHCDSLFLAEPFSRIFINREEALWAFEMIASAANLLGIDSPEEQRLAVTIQKKYMGLHINFGNWLLLGFYGSNKANRRLRLPLLEEKELDSDIDNSYKFAQNQDEPAIASYLLPMEKPLDNIQHRYVGAMKHIASRFKKYNKSPYRKHHLEQIAGAIFDRELLMSLLTEGLYMQDELDESELATQDPLYINEEYSLEKLAAGTETDPRELERWIKAIERKGQAILYGPPGTGKTFLAKALARHLIGGSDGLVDLVQFHPAYAYEDFIQGIRPQVNNEGILKYPVLPGRLLQFCQKARNRQGLCVLIIDEINRANLSRVFGELMYLLEYRDAEIPLASGGTFSLPRNVRIIGTMNTADRSIALVDFALRRRFAFIPLQPNYEVLRRYHTKTGLGVEDLIETLMKLNRRINDPNYEIGVSFFLRADLWEQLEDIWRMEIEPYIEEFFFDQPEKVEDFRWDKIREKVLS